MTLKLLGAVVLLSSISGFAQVKDCPDEAQPTLADQLSHHVVGCPNSEGLESICRHVSELTLENENTKFKYHYQTLMHESACVSPSDGSAAIALKMQTLWDAHLKNFTCANSGFNVTNGNLVKYAIFSASDSFVYDVSRKWKLDLNRVDPSDNRTALDYAYDELASETAKGSTLATKIQSYIKLLEANGAKRRANL